MRWDASTMHTNYHTMPFGCHKGWPLTALPDDYLRWLRGRELRDPLRSAVNREWQRRTAAPPTRRTTVQREWAERIVGAGTRALALKHHPDVGGNAGDMVAINLAAEWLRATTRELSA